MDRTRNTILILLVAVCLCGCSNLWSGEVTESADAAVTQSETAVVTEPAYIIPPTEQASLVALTDTVPVYDKDSTVSFVMRSQEKNGYFVAEYLHVYPRAAEAVKPITDDVILVFPSDQEEMKSGNHYYGFAVEGDTVKQLETVSYSEDLSIMDAQYRLEFEYIIHNGKIYLTYVPPGGPLPDEKYAFLDTDILNAPGRKIEDSHSCPINFLFHDVKTNRYLMYSAVVDLHTQEVRDVYTAYEVPEGIAIPEDTYVQAKYGNGGYLLASASDSNAYYFLDMPGEKLYDLYSLAGGKLKSCFEVNGPIVLQMQSKKADQRSSFWVFDREKQTFDAVLEDIRVDEYKGQLGVFYRDQEGNAFVYNIEAKEKVLLPDFRELSLWEDTFVTFVTTDGQVAVYDLQTKEIVCLPALNDWNMGGGSVSPGGRKFLITRHGGGTLDLLIYDLEDRTLTEIIRTNPNGVQENYAYWNTDNEIVVYNSDDARDLCRYRF